MFHSVFFAFMRVQKHYDSIVQKISHEFPKFMYENVGHGLNVQHGQDDQYVRM